MIHKRHKIASVIRALGAAAAACAGMALHACGPTVVRPGSSTVGAELTGGATWTFRCDPAANAPPGAEPIDLALATIEVRCASERPGATLVLTLQSWYSHTQRRPTPPRMYLDVTLAEVGANGAPTLRVATAQLRSFNSLPTPSGTTVSGQFTVSGEVNGHGDFELVAR